MMCLPNQVLIYGDCAINPDPNAEELADIALQSAASAEAFGIEPRVAMISYSTGSSGKQSNVDKVRETTRIAQECRPNTMLIDGPMQCDAAASNAEVAKSKKAPNSKVAGQAIVLIFPALNTCNTAYKAIQRTANVVAISRWIGDGWHLDS
jgi:phosphate acetyltransferase